MASIISAGTTDSTSLNISGDKTGILQLASNNAVTAVTIDASQNVGIGTTSPGYRLDVGTNSVAGNIHTYGSITSGTLAGYSIKSIPRLTNDTGTFENTYIGCGASVGNIIFQQGNSFTTASNIERMRIDSGGSVQVGTTSALGSARVTIKTPDGSGSLIPLTLAVGLVSDGYGGVSFRNPNGAQGGISINSTSVTYNTTSDYRLKEDVQPMTGALAKVAQLKPVTYKWKINGRDSEGFIAHELAEVCPQAVTGEKDAVDEEGNPKHQGIDTSFLVATLTAAMQELKAINDTQAETINALTARLEALENN
jgi:hypothetical protein